MKNRIDLNKFNIRTDLIIDSDINSSYVKTKRISDNINITSIDINDELSSNLNKKKGLYITIEFTDITNHEDKLEIEDVLVSELKKLLLKNNINDDDEGLIIGLGNRFSTADSLGPKTIDNLVITRHLYLLNLLKIHLML